jgi:hypothetical protein
MSGMLRVPRSRGVLSGFLLLLLGLWGGLVAFAGPYFHYAYTPDRAWVYTSGRLWLEILPGLATAIGGLIVIVSANRAVAAFGAWLAALGGAWFVVGRTFSVWPATHIPQVGVPTGSPLMQTVEQIGFFSGLGVVIVFIAAFALGRFAVVAARDAAIAEEQPKADTEAAEKREELVDTNARTILGRHVAPARSPAASASGAPSGSGAAKASSGT